MCVIIHAKPKQTIEKKVLENCYNRNRDGWGIMWAENNKVYTVKDLSSFDNFYKIWINEVPRHAERGIHFRIRTAGATNQANCHPFRPAQGVAMMHNGHINTPLIEDGMSDTYNFCMYELAPLIAGWNDYIKDEDFKKLMEMHEVTGSSKLLFIDAEGSSLRINDRMWHVHEGVHFSNQHSLSKPYQHTTNYPKNYGTTPSTSLVTANFNKTAVVSSGSLSSTYEDDQDGDWGDKDPDVLDYAGFRHLRSAITPSTTLLGGPTTKSAERIVSDMFAGNKTDEEGQAYLTHLQEEAKKAVEEEQQELACALADCGGEEVDPFPPEEATIASQEEEEAEDDNEDLQQLDLNSIMAMSMDELTEDIETFPKSYAFAIRALIDTCNSAGIFKEDLTQEGETTLDAKVSS